MRGETKKKLSFGGGLLIYITVMITVIFVGLAVWWHYLSCYETARAERVMDAYMQQSFQDDLEAAIMSYCEETTTGYQSVKDISGVLTDALGSDAWHYEPNHKNSTEEAPVFDLYVEETPVGQVRLSVGENSTLNMGFREWKDPTPTFDFDQFSHSLTVIAPYDCGVYFNGQLIGEDAVEETMGMYPQLESYEAMIGQPNQLLVYRVDKVFADVAVEYATGFVSQPSSQPNVYYATPACDDTLGQQLNDYAKSFVQAYVTYTAKAESLWALQQFIVADSALYQKVSDEEANKQREEVEIKTTDIKNFVYYGNAITCEASYITTRADGDHVESMKILMINTDIGWRVVHIEPRANAPVASVEPAPTETPAPSEPPVPSEEPVIGQEDANASSPEPSEMPAET